MVRESHLGLQFGEGNFIKSQRKEEFMVKYQKRKQNQNSSHKVPF